MAATELVVGSTGSNGEFGGTAMVVPDATNGNSFDNDGNTVLILIESAVGPTGGNVVIAGVSSPDSGRSVDVTMITTAMVAPQAMVAGPFKTANFNSGGKVLFTVTAATATAKIGAIRLG